MRVVSSQSEEKVRRKRARDDLVWPLRSLTANLLRIIRGSGKPHLLMKQMDACLNALGAFVEAHGSAPSAHEISKILDPDETFRRSGRGEPMTIPERKAAPTPCGSYAEAPCRPPHLCC
jgi:hypothetical protein